MKKNDFIIIGIVLLLGIVGYLVMGFIQNQSSGDTWVIIRHDGNVIEEIPFDSETEETFIYNDGDETNTVVISNGVVTVTEANCRDQICVKTQSISKNGEIIVCLPHQLTVEIYSESGEVELDSIAE
jgi:hypothetical protein